ncbi:MAG: imidazole glycerol phosphate synthase cyclase subunit [Verrucomicrobiota bacterium]
MSEIRIIPRLEVKSGRLIKGIRMEGLRQIGHPTEFAKSYFTQGADEIFFEDIVASLYDRKFQKEIFQKFTEDISIPLCVAGGIRNIDDVYELLKAGADKIAVNTHGIQRPHLITEAAQAFGSQCVVLQVQAKQQPGGTWNAYTQSGRENTGVDVLEWVQKAQDLGAGEILLVSVDRDGLHRGPDLELIEKVTSRVSIPVIAGGGVGNIDHIEAIIRQGKVRAVAVSHVLHFGLNTIQEIKQELSSRGISVRENTDE